jgi:hypothetical protein
VAAGAEYVPSLRNENFRIYTVEGVVTLFVCGCERSACGGTTL